MQYLYNMQLQTTSPESKFPNEYNDAILVRMRELLLELCLLFRVSQHA